MRPSSSKCRCSLPFTVMPLQLKLKKTATSRSEANRRFTSKVDDLTRSRKVTAEQLAALRVEERQLGEEEARHRGRLERTVGEFLALEPKAAPVLLAVLPDEQRVMVEPLLLTTEPKGKVALPVPAPRLALDIPRPRPR